MCRDGGCNLEELVTAILCHVLDASTTHAEVVPWSSKHLDTSSQRAVAETGTLYTVDSFRLSMP